MPDHLLTWICLLVALYILLSALDDFWLDLFWVIRKFRRSRTFKAPQVSGPIAVWVPCWHESAVIGQMLAHNRDAIVDQDFDFFVGVYPNDAETVEAANAASRKDPGVHIAITPHDGPTSKADCLNSIHQRMLSVEQQSGRRYSLVIIHDAEDLIHPESFSRVRQAAGAGYGMIQVPVLALPTRLHELTHGLYCDDFAESQTKDLLSRVQLGGFLPGCGVGTAFRREVLDRMESGDSGPLFDPSSLTEDYDNGLRLFCSGIRQCFLPVEWKSGLPVATREYFPRTVAAAVKQRARWITGNSLQAWERFGWGAGMRQVWTQRYFFWRDRKGLWGAPLGLLANLMLCLVAWSRFVGETWSPEPSPLGQTVAFLMWLNGTLLLERVAVRIHVVANVYGFPFAMLSPVRTLWGNALNSAACVLALWCWLRHKFFGAPLRWAKTDHAYPPREALAVHGGSLENTEDFVVGFSMALLEPGKLSRDVARSLPRRLQHDHCLLPIGVNGGELEVAVSSIPSRAVTADLERYTRLRLRYTLAPKGAIAKARATLQSPS